MAKGPFKLKSGNKPTFKNIGGSPVDLKNFGIGKGTSPYEQGEGEGKGQGWKQAAGLIGSMLTGGLDAVYGSGKVVPMSDRLLKKDKKEECPLGYKRNAAGKCVKIGE